MKVKSVVTCLPVKNIKTSFEFYKNIFQLEPLIEDKIVTVELSNLSLFLIEEKEFEKYLPVVNHTAHHPQKESQLIFSLAVENKNEIAVALKKVVEFGGKVVQNLKPNEWQQESCYIQDPDGHLFEIVWVKKS